MYAPVPLTLSPRVSKVRVKSSPAAPASVRVCTSFFTLPLPTKEKAQSRWLAGLVQSRPSAAVSFLPTQLSGTSVGEATSSSKEPLIRRLGGSQSAEQVAWVSSPVQSESPQVVQSAAQFDAVSSLLQTLSPQTEDGVQSPGQ